MSSPEQDDYIRYLVASEIAHSQAALDGEDTSTESDLLSKWGLVIIAGILGGSALISLISVFVVMAL